MIKEVDITVDNPFRRRIEYFIEEESVGYLEYSLIYDRMEIDNIMVNEAHRSEGIGTKLMAHLVSLAIEYRVDNITLEALYNERVMLGIEEKTVLDMVYDSITKASYNDYHDSLISKLRKDFAGDAKLDLYPYNYKSLIK